MGSVDDRIENNTFYDPMSGCHLWTGCSYGRGYGWINFKGKSQPVHRLVYRLVFGDIPEGYEVHHLCGTKLCLNPSHLQALSKAEHTKIGPAARCSGIANRSKTQCKHGHEFTEENTILYGPKQYRYCRKCRNARANESYYRKGFALRREKLGSKRLNQTGNPKRIKGY